MATFSFTAKVTYPNGITENYSDECYGMGSAMAEVDAMRYMDSMFPDEKVEILSVSPLLNIVG